MSLLKTGRPSRKDKAITSVQENKEETIRMNINLSKQFYRQIKQKALDQDTTVTEIVMNVLEEYMNEK